MNPLLMQQSDSTTQGDWSAGIEDRVAHNSSMGKCFCFASIQQQIKGTQKRTQHESNPLQPTYHREMVCALVVHIILPTLGFNHLDVAPRALDPWEVTNLGRA
jgi:hypothetical protein